MVEMAKGLGDDQNLSFAMAQHERQLVFPEDRHGQIEDRANARTGKIERGEPPTVRKLHGDDVVAADAETGEADCDPVRHRGEFPVGESSSLPGFALDGGQREPVGAMDEAGVEIVVDRPVAPVAARHAFRPARR
jgi:hypothetical protein